MGRDPSKTFSARRDRAQFDKVTRKAQAKPEAHSSHEGEPASEADAEVYSHFYDDTGWKGSATPPSNPFMPFIEDGWSLDFAEFCILAQVKVKIELKNVENFTSGSQYRVTCVMPWGQYILSDVQDRVFLRDEGDLANIERYLRRAIHEAQWQYHNPKTIKSESMNAAFERECEIKDNYLRAGCRSFWESRDFVERKKAESAARSARQSHDHAADAFRYYADSTFWNDEVSSRWNYRFQKMYGDETYAKIWETLFRGAKPRGFDDEYVRKSRQAAQEEPRPKPAGEYRAGKSYSDAQRQAIDKARKARNLRDDDRCDPGTRDNAGRMVFKLLNAHALTEWDLM